MANQVEKARLEFAKLDKLITFLKEVRGEVTKVTWPGREEVKSATLVVIIVCIFVALVLWVIDAIIRTGVEAIF
jgi:preprotein translocase subunit SecE